MFREMFYRLPMINPVYSLIASNVLAVLLIVLMIAFPWMIPFIIVQFIGFVLLSIGVANMLLQPEA